MFGCVGRGVEGAGWGGVSWDESCQEVPWGPCDLFTKALGGCAVPGGGTVLCAGVSNVLPRLNISRPVQ